MHIQNQPHPVHKYMSVCVCMYIYLSVYIYISQMEYIYIFYLTDRILVNKELMHFYNLGQDGWTYRVLF